MKEKAKRIARNPRTGKKVRVPAKISPAFKPGKELKKLEKVIR
jgi:DNA-binding protein HU-beta